MNTKKYFDKLKKYHCILNGSTIEYDLTNHITILSEIKKYSAVLSCKSDSRLKNISRELINNVKRSNQPDDYLVESYGLVNATISRVLKLHPFDVQIIGGIALHRRKMIEMQTGEGKTLVAVFPAYLNALSGNGVHILTFNDYLARRDAVWMGPVYEFLGLSVSFVQEGMSPEKRKIAYNSDITYLTAKEAGFDYLRDCLCYNTKDCVQREFNFALVDEADSIMIDEARVPLIIAGTSENFVDNVISMSQVVKQLKEKFDFGFDENYRNINLTEGGIKRVESIFKCNNLYDKENTEKLSALNCALHAEHLLHRDVDYIVRKNKIELVDEFTGRVADKRRWPDGLQAALEAKENLPICSGGKILNSITLQHFLLLYPQLCGMTATAQAAEKEFKEFYNLDIVPVPPGKDCIRKDHPDRIFFTKAAKQNALIEEIINKNKTGRPILVGTRSVNESSELSNKLKEAGVNCKVLNALNDEEEAAIIAGAGQENAVTISTNMAGRGTDIKLGGGDEKLKKKIAALGGLYVIGTNRHESRRIDSQLRGRAGRQGDPGSSRFFISMEDDLFVKYNLKNLIPSKYLSEQGNEQLYKPGVIKEIERIQRIIEGQNLEIKNTLYKYSFLLEEQRKILFDKRTKILCGDNFMELFRSGAPEQFYSLKKILGNPKLLEICRRLSLLRIDAAWLYYLADIADIKEAIHLQVLGGQNPVLVFRKESISLFDSMMDELNNELLIAFNKLKIVNGEADLSETGLNAPSSTWTYLINDNPFENILGTALIGNIGLSIGAGAYGFLFAVYFLWKKFREKRNRNLSDIT